MEEFTQMSLSDLGEALVIAEYQICPAFTYESLAKEFRTKAGKHFEWGEDEKAKWFRDLAKELEERGKHHRNGIGTKMSDRKRLLYLELERREAKPPAADAVE